MQVWHHEQQSRTMQKWRAAVVSLVCVFVPPWGVLESCAPETNNFLSAVDAMSLETARKEPKETILQGMMRGLWSKIHIKGDLHSDGLSRGCCWLVTDLLVAMRLQCCSSIHNQGYVLLSRNCQNWLCYFWGPKALPWKEIAPTDVSWNESSNALPISVAKYTPQMKRRAWPIQSCFFHWWPQ